MNQQIYTQGEFFYTPSQEQKLFRIMRWLVFFIMVVMSCMVIVYGKNGDWSKAIHCFTDFCLWGIALHTSSLYIDNNAKHQCTPITFTECQDGLKITTAVNYEEDFATEHFIAWGSFTQATYNTSSHLLHLQFSNNANEPKGEFRTISYIPDEKVVLPLSKMILEHTNIFLRYTYTRF